ncbi:hypothetical protein VOLCADRAFT_109989 [Volvox carteri f. nagariensis]|uniref:tRNA/rRNA methyltransferase SpoU type domain-containing protein n=1 Tax=Volvox carteri f. nagariensis TaxID=3068 RepID=D8UBC2_VOLCA|nr:uncharacterized protein VOLCADRAFT_109989 [Volvox carteri f. nagariensis]EFJ42923.1 hypothetical protein VOLCADRAFT_109989 [Volvox carteri f. nagariensis]|eukprot:XP_002955963.1 hypothetical protein VOLCADRAFT_109989 [Volvox carteri f. nagariensis]
MNTRDLSSRRCIHGQSLFRRQQSCTHIALGSRHRSLQPVSTQDVGFPYSNEFVLEDGKVVDAATVVRLLAPFALEERVQRIESVVQNRTFSVLPIVEGLYDMGNLAAVCRTADALGYGAVHCINRGDVKYKVSQRTAAGADKWLDVKMWDSTAECLAAVRSAGYQIITTHLSQSAITIEEVDWTRPTAFILGNEKFGVSEEAVAAADACAIIPMTGMVESFNISVASALIMYEARQQRLRRMGTHADLSGEERMALKAVMLSKTVKESKTVLSELLSRPPPRWQAAAVRATAKQASLYEEAVAARTAKAAGR